MEVERILAGSSGALTVQRRCPELVDVSYRVETAGSVGHVISACCMDTLAGLCELL